LRVEVVYSAVVKARIFAHVSVSAPRSTPAACCPPFCALLQGVGTATERMWAILFWVACRLPHLYEGALF